MGYRRRNKKLTSNFYWNRSSSEPDLISLPLLPSSSPPLTSRWHKPLPHEYIAVDELGFHRRRKPPDLYTRSNICLQNLSEPSIEKAVATEYRNQFSDTFPCIGGRPPLRRRSTSLKLEGGMEILSEQKTKYKFYTTEELSGSRPLLYKHPENLNLIGDIQYLPEYKSSYVTHEIREIPRRFKNTKMVDYLGEEVSQPNRPKMPHPSQCHLRMEGEQKYLPEYKSQFIEFPIEKSYSIPQITSIKFQGDFKNIPEYQESFRTYNNVAKSAPFRKPDNLTTYGQIDANPEYREQFKEPIMDRIGPMRKSQDNLKMSGEFSKDLPEYYESFRDYHITRGPERAKGRQPYFSLNGPGQFNPEYRCNYVDFPRSRPKTKKPHSNIILPIDADRYRPPMTNAQKLTFVNNQNIHEPVLDDVPFMDLPEYRKAKTDYLIRERSSSRDRKILQNELEDDNQSPLGSPIKVKSPSPTHFRMMVENVDDMGGTFKKSSPKFGRRANDIRNKTSVIEGNPRYFKKNSGYIKVADDKQDPAFVVLDEPCKQSAWMKPKWYM